MSLRRSLCSYIAVLGAALWLLPAGAEARNPTTREYPYLYKSPRAMGMGGAYTAVGGRTDTLFYNPAGLSTIPQDKEWDVSLLDLSAEAGKNSIDFYKDLKDALDTPDLNGDGQTDDDQQRAVNDLLARYRGENLHVRVSDITGAARSWQSFGFGLAAFGSGRADAIPHQGFSEDGVLELNADATYGGLGGVSATIMPNLFVGVTVKYLKRESVVHSFTSRELVDHQDDLSSYVKDTYQKSGTAVGCDAGVLWKFAEESWWRPAVALSALNIGDLDFKDAGSIPMSINAGIAISPRIAWSRSLIIAADYIDIANSFKEDKDKVKRFRYGAELQLFDTTTAEMAVRAGIYQGAPTFGADLRLLIFKVSYTMYSEEIGAYAGQDRDRRQMLTLNIGW